MLSNSSLLNHDVLIAPSNKTKPETTQSISGKSGSSAHVLFDIIEELMTSAAARHPGRSGWCEGAFFLSS